MCHGAWYSYFYVSQKRCTEFHLTEFNKCFYGRFILCFLHAQSQMQQGVNATGRKCNRTLMYFQPGTVFHRPCAWNYNPLHLSSCWNTLGDFPVRWPKHQRRLRALLTWVTLSNYFDYGTLLWTSRFFSSSVLIAHVWNSFLVTVLVTDLGRERLWIIELRLIVLLQFTTDQGCSRAWTGLERPNAFLYEVDASTQNFIHKIHVT